jgi:hypothetical protein
MAALVSTKNQIETADDCAHDILLLKGLSANAGDVTVASR